MSLGGGHSAEGSNAGGIFVQFNQDCTSLVAGSSSGYHLFALTADDGIEEIYASQSGQDTCLVDRLFSSSLVAIVTVSAPRKLIVCHYKKGTEICNYSYSNTILAVKLNRSRLVVCLEESLHIHNIRDMKILHTIRDTPPNPRGLCALSPSAELCLVAYPGSSAVGEVQIFDCVHLHAKCVIAAHDSPLAALAWSACGRRLATASERGTVIRVFLVPERTRLYEFRRGVKRCVAIACLAFSACGAYLAATSNTETVHVFRLQEGAAGGAAPERAAEGEGAAPEGWMDWLSSAVSAGAGYLPAQVADVLAQGRAFASARLPRAAKRAVAAVTNVARRPRLVVATDAGAVHVFALDAAEGGDCALLRTHRLLDAPPAAPLAEPPAAPGCSYAGALRGRQPDTLTESERAAELGAALAGSPPRGAFDLRDHRHFPPMRTPANTGPAPE
ncbi:WD repeat domain phosphoinositide-interacting protein 2 isoform X2 [Maniola jurtina]|uniref:WD repeat domain phosphoinositide-interacting protein 2 isoform X2 n=1 Tax=Maniola jurtina TaxID=191418 RepID=UPI001E6865FD|nr:WD repeat domain phosphoinositide-interacting protein 2 isoform X2 [Maniola jurtina]XP_045771330.1 WD repeat domain phosphoinositide-interacting protein 2 isoform X2 [Maniola jurtina]